jgi:hypothetical protein
MLLIVMAFPSTWADAPGIGAARNLAAGAWHNKAQRNELPGSVKGIPKRSSILQSTRVTTLPSGESDIGRSVSQR